MPRNDYEWLNISMDAYLCLGMTKKAPNCLVVSVDDYKCLTMSMNTCLCLGMTDACLAISLKIIFQKRAFVP